MFNSTRIVGSVATFNKKPLEQELSLEEFEFLRIQIWKRHKVDIRFEKIPLTSLTAEFAEQPRQPYIITSAGKAIQRDLALRFICNKLVKEYGYSYSMMRVNVPIPGYDAKERARAIFYEDTKMAHPYILIETVDKVFSSTPFDELTRETVEKARALKMQYAVIVTYSCDFIALDIELWSESSPEQARLPDIPRASKKEPIEMEY